MPGTEVRRHLSLLCSIHANILFFLVWIMGHVLSGWDGTNGLKNPTDLCESMTTFYIPRAKLVIVYQMSVGTHIIRDSCLSSLS